MNIQSDSKIKPTFALYLAQIINLLSGWGITKLNISFLTVGEYGQFSFFITFINATFILFTFGVFEASSRLMAITESKEKSARLLSASLILALVSYALFSGFLLVCRDVIHHIFTVDISHLLRLYFPLAGVYLLYDYWQKMLRGAGKIYRLSWFLVTPRILYFICLSALIYAHQFTLVYSTLFNLVSFGIILILFILRERLHFRGIKVALNYLLAEVKGFGFHMYWAELIHILLYHIDKLFIGFFLDAEQLAYYSLAFTITLPLSLFSTSLSTTLYKSFSHTEKIESKVIFINLLWVLLSLLVLIILGPWIVIRLFSENYQASVPLLIPLAIAFGISAQSKTFTYYLIAQGEGKIIRNISFILLVGSLLLNAIFIPVWGIMGAALVRLIIFLIDSILVLIYYYRKQKN
jgi:O-antigen/teichoic acid export membrane protein